MRRGCVYCGLPRVSVKKRGRTYTLPTCSAHADLIPLDPVYGLTETLARSAYPAVDLAAMSPTEKRREPA